MASREYITKRARKVISQAQEEARALSEDHISSEHFLLALLYEEDSIAFCALKLIGIEPCELYQEVKQQCAVGKVASIQNLHVARSAKRVIDLSFEEARLHNNRYIIHTGDYLIGVIREKKGLAGRILASHGVSLKVAQQAVKVTCQTVLEPLEEPDPDSVWPPPIFRPELEPAPPPKLPLQSNRVTLGSIFSAFGGQRMRPKTIAEEPYDIPRLAEAIIRNANTKNSPMARITSQTDGTHIEYYVSVSFQDALTLPSDLFDALITQLEAMSEQEDADFTIASESDDEYLLTINQSA